MTWINKKDAVGHIIKPGHICVKANRIGGCEYCIFIGSAWGGKRSTGEYGQFITTRGNTSVKYKNVLLAYDPLVTEGNVKEIKELVRTYYERKSK